MYVPLHNNQLIIFHIEKNKYEKSLKPKSECSNTD